MCHLLNNFYIIELNYLMYIYLSSHEQVKFDSRFFELEYVLLKLSKFRYTLIYLSKAGYAII